MPRCELRQALIEYAADLVVRGGDDALREVELGVDGMNDERFFDVDADDSVRRLNAVRRPLERIHLKPNDLCWNLKERSSVSRDEAVQPGEEPCDEERPPISYESLSIRTVLLFERRSRVAQQTLFHMMSTRYIDHP